MGAVESTEEEQRKEEEEESLLSSSKDMNGMVSAEMQTEAEEQPAEEGAFTEPPELGGLTTEGAGDGRTAAVEGVEQGEQEQQQEAEEEEVVRLRKRVKELEDQVRSWQNVARDFVFSFALGPEMTHWYSSFLREYLQDALLEIPQVEKVIFAECSFPSVPKEAPVLELSNWEGMSFGEWNVSWAPKSWWIALSVTGRQSPLPTRFNAVVTISGLKLKGKLRTALPNDVSSLRFAFCGKPEVNFSTSFQLNWGRLPLPVKVSIESRVQQAIEDFIRTKMQLPNSYWIVLRRNRKVKLDDKDLRTAINAAQRARDLASAQVG